MLNELEDCFLTRLFFFFNKRFTLPVAIFIKNTFIFIYGMMRSYLVKIIYYIIDGLGFFVIYLFRYWLFDLLDYIGEVWFSVLLFKSFFKENKWRYGCNLYKTKICFWTLFWLELLDVKLSTKWSKILKKKTYFYLSGGSYKNFGSQAKKVWEDIDQN